MPEFGRLVTLKLSAAELVPLAQVMVDVWAALVA